MMKSFKYNEKQLMIKGEKMNFVPKERAEASINKLLSERRKRKMKEIEEMEIEYENSK